jgi:hypothetical protein
MRATISCFETGWILPGSAAAALSRLDPSNQPD